MKMILENALLYSNCKIKCVFVSSHWVSSNLHSQDERLLSIQLVVAKDAVSKQLMIHRLYDWRNAEF